MQQTNQSVRVATEAAKLLKEKHKPTYTTHMDVGDNVIINCKKLILTGKKMDQKVYRDFSGYIGGMKELTARRNDEQEPRKKLWHMQL